MIIYTYPTVTTAGYRFFNLLRILRNEKKKNIECFTILCL
jgi:hypothetical protein